MYSPLPQSHGSISRHRAPSLIYLNGTLSAHSPFQLSRRFQPPPPSTTFYYPPRSSTRITHLQLRICICHPPFTSYSPIQGCRTRMVCTVKCGFLWLTFLLDARWALSPTHNSNDLCFSDSPLPICIGLRNALQALLHRAALRIRTPSEE